MTKDINLSQLLAMITVSGNGGEYGRKNLFIGAFALGAMFGVTITEMVFEQKQKEQEGEKDDIQ